MRWREENRSALLQPATGAGARESIDSVGGGSGGRPASAGVSSLGQLLRQKYWQQDARVMQSGDTQDSNVLGGAVVAVDRQEGHGSVDHDQPPSYTSKSATLLDMTTAGEEMALDDEDRDWHSPHPDHDEPVHSIEFADDSEDEVPDFHDSPLAQSDMAASGSSQLAPVTESALDDDYELIHVQPGRHHHEPVHHDPVHPTDARVHSPVIASLHPSRRASPAPSDSSVGYHHAPVEPRPGSRGGLPPRAHKPPPPPPPPRRHHIEEDVPPTLAFDPFESLPPPAEMMMQRVEPDEEEMEEEAAVADADDDAAHAHPYWHASKPTDL